MRWILALCACVLSAATPPDPAGWQVLFRDSFETVLGSGWRTWSAPEDPTAGWAIRSEGGNGYLAGTGQANATYVDGRWGDQRFSARLRLNRYQAKLVFRSGACTAYVLTFETAGTTLSRRDSCTGPENILKASGPGPPLGSWQQVDIVATGANIKVYLAGALRIDYTDTDPLPAGNVALWSIPGGGFDVDDIEVAGPPEAVFPSWVRTGGPLGGVGYDIRVSPANPDLMYVTDVYAGVHISTDGGSSWTPSNQGIAGRSGSAGDAVPIFCLTVDPLHPNTVWAGMQNTRGVYKSTDGGRTWVTKERGIVEVNGISFRGFAVDPKDSNIVYAAAEISSSAWAGQQRVGRYYDLAKGVVYKTTDGGENWTAIWRGENLARYIWIDTRDSKVLYVSMGIFDREAADSDASRDYPGSGGVAKSTDGGKTWRLLGTANGLKNPYIGSLYMHPANPDILLAGAGNLAYPQDSGVYLTTDAGETWRNVLPVWQYDGSSSDNIITVVEYAGSNPAIAYAASAQTFYRSDDGARTWQLAAGLPHSMSWAPEGIFPGSPIDLQADPRNADRVFANNYAGGVFLSEDGARTWRNMSAGYTGADVPGISVDPGDSRRVYVATRTGAYRSDDGGSTWRSFNSLPANWAAYFQGKRNFAEWQAAAVSPADPAVVLFGEQMCGTVMRSSDHGADWRIAYKKPEADCATLTGEHGVKAFAFAPSSASVVYASMSRTAWAFGLGTPDPSYGVFKSSDGGQTWREANDANTAARSINTLAVDARNEAVVCAGTATGGVFVSRDGGASWSALNAGLGGLDVRALAVDPRNSSVLYAGLEGGGVFKSTDGGAHWVRGSTGMDPTATVRAIVVDPTDSTIVYAADLRTGVYRSDDGGKLWVQIDKGLTMRAVKALTISSDGGTLYAATEGGGVFRLDIRPDAATTVSSVSAASFAVGAALAPESIASGFGKDLAAATQTANGAPLPTALGGVSVSVTDSAGTDRPAPLFFVSAGQINFEVPAGTVAGQAMVRVLQQNQVVARGSANVDAVAPGLFTANADGKGVPAALALRVAANGAQSPLDVYRCGTAAGSCAPVPIDLGAATDQVILELFGTGIRGRSALAGVTAKIGGQDAEVLYGGPQGGFAGLDQVNIRVPRSLIGRGDVDVVLRVDNKMANAVVVRIL